MNCSTTCGLVSAANTDRRNCLVVNSSVWPLPARSPTHLVFSCLMNRQAIWTRKPLNYVFDALSALVRASGVATLFATHNMELAGRMDRAITLEDGLVTDSLAG